MHVAKSATIAGVYANRLAISMKLDADPTIQYLLEEGPRRLFYTDLVRDSPYNTYRHAGLPPGPVNNPGRTSILAALYPARHQFLFFVANGQGGHWFSSTYDQHMRNVRLARRLRANLHSSDEFTGARVINVQVCRARRGTIGIGPDLPLRRSQSAPQQRR